MNLTIKEYQRFSKELMQLFDKYNFHVTGEALSLEDTTLIIRIHTPCAEEIQSYIINLEETEDDK